MCDGGFAFQQIFFIRGIILGNFQIRARKSRDGIARLPKGKRYEVCDIPLDSLQNPRALVARVAR